MTVASVLNGCRIVPVIVIDDASRAADVAAALRDGGITTAEVTLRTPAGLAAIAAMAQVEGFTVGAGTVLTVADVDAVRDAGARYIVSPGFDDEVVARGLDLSLAVLPGVATATEIQRALKAGIDEVKLFPADRLGGLDTILALAGPFPQVRFVPSGGVDASTAGPYLAHPAILAVSGSWMASRQLIASGDLDEIRRLSAAASAL